MGETGNRTRNLFKTCLTMVESVLIMAFDKPGKFVHKLLAFVEAKIAIEVQHYISLVIPKDAKRGKFLAPAALTRLRRFIKKE